MVSYAETSSFGSLQPPIWSTPTLTALEARLAGFHTVGSSVPQQVDRPESRSLRTAQSVHAEPWKPKRSRRSSWTLYFEKPEPTSSPYFSSSS